MNKNIYIVIGVAVLLLLAAGAWFFYSGSMPGAGAPALQEAPLAAATPPAPGVPATLAGTAVQAGDAAKSAMPDAVGKANPFKADVNPVSGYQNPFE